MGHHLPLLLLLIMCKSLEAWNCTVSCNCTDFTSSCCGPQKTRLLPIIGHQNATELVLDSCGSFPMDNNTLQNFRSLEELIVKRTSLLYLDAHAFHSLPMLQTLNLTQVNLSNAAMHQNAFASLLIRRLFLAKNQLDQIRRGMFAGLMNLEHLDLSGNGLRSIEENALANLVSLHFLNLDDNHFVTITPYWFGVMFRNNSFPVVSLIGNALTCECKYRGMTLPEYQWFSRSVILTNFSCMVNLTVEECSPPRVEEIYKEVTVRDLQPLTLSCPLSGFPRPRVSWTLPSGLQLFNKSFPPFYNVDGTLYVQLVQSKFAGLYACMATNVEGTAVILLNIVVSPTPEPPFITSRPVTFPTPQTPTISRSLWVLLWTAIVFICIIFLIILFCILRVVCRYLNQHLRNDVSFNRFVDTPNILALPENPQPIPHIEERHGHVRWSRENGDDTVPRVVVHTDGSYPHHQQTATELESGT
ncbi:leucine-rich repeat-containing protein 24-like [Acipenser oxyrinchus oxyrinchus]|uniref:Leucine-rich repeat-containing protein 24-like n=1 Tax=Acipenser oxyrinchus oxyrinchus TaxID=40147 RepID=A0AAD8D796_ACIOX|nr:leucine-rich repeat-containing protein 24-like [Acipenser oxyrinchus oxyrinchus]